MTSAIRWEPIEDLKALRDMLRTTVRPRRFMRSVVDLPALATRRWQLLGVRQPVDVYETLDAYVAEIDVPGVEAKDLDITVAANRMTVRGKRQSPEAQEGAPTLPDYLYRERPQGQFTRALTVPSDVDASTIGAKLENGVLIVTMPKKGADEAHRTTIPIMPPPPEPSSE